MLPIVFIPGLLCDERLWRDQQAALADLAPSIVADVTRDDSVAGMAARLLADAPPRFSVVALSMGGYVAFEVLRQARERVGAVALLDTSAAPDAPGRSAEREAALASLSRGRFAGVTDRLLPRLIDEQHLGGPVGEDLKAMAQRVGGEAFVRQQTAILNRPDSRPLLGSLDIPALVAVGDGDVLTPPSESVAMFRALPRPWFHLFHRCGHLPAIEQPEETSALLRRWLATTT
ncbi:alpha/beta hydrolase [Phenylobacterium sp. Root77]|uniref:alpha/beta fold hydrolase n=1 Tax=unclassified Phenylobacterium TaxID=2640670 RepID=UPI0006FF97BD|nr:MULTISPECIES: alpha/beta hydrolase [unclassified Phenylobacterium]KQW72069.1 alpha/beta hydrolase [Phenylobacterium sp. Root1277]KQW94989.1 alpha/beta hydrolase [Phenylobacterium sp. Root1290]KRC44682.1 alpha/beta hydrolase [Phenylobacterium sp. Root77]